MRNGLTSLEKLATRGDCGCDTLTGDGARTKTQVPEKFLRKECQKNHIVLPPEGEYGVGNVFLPPNLEERNAYEEWFEQIIHGEGQKFWGWRDIPHDSSQIGKVANSVEL